MLSATPTQPDRIHRALIDDKFEAMRAAYAAEIEVEMAVLDRQRHGADAAELLDVKRRSVTAARAGLIERFGWAPWPFSQAEIANDT